MSRTTPLLLVAALAVLAAPRAASAETAFHLDMELGVSHFMEDAGLTGLSLGLTPGVALKSGLVLEADLGYHSGSEGPVTFAAYPMVMPGVSYEFEAGALRPFFDAHAGVALLRSSVDFSIGGDLFGTSSLSSSTTALAFNVGGGLAYLINDTVGLGGQLGLWWFNEGDGFTMIDAGLHASFRF